MPSLLFLIRVFLCSAVVAKVAEDQSANANDIVWQLRNFLQLMSTVPQVSFVDVARLSHLKGLQVYNSAMEITI